MRLKMLLAATAAAAVGLGLGLAASAAAAPNSYEIRLEGQVPVICRVDLENRLAATGQATELGRMTEFCNSPAGYEVWLSHAPGLSDAAIYVDDQRIALSSTGSTLISRSRTAASQSHALRLDPGADAGRIGDLALRIGVL